MGGASSYLAILAICGFLTATWLATKLSQKCGISSIVLEIGTGIALGPTLLGLMPKEYATCEYLTHMECEVPADLTHRLENGISLGRDLDHYALLPYCDRAAYEHHGEAGHHSAPSHSEGEMHGAHDGEVHDVGANDGAAHDGGAHDGGRRLSGGGGSYASFEECLGKTCEAEISHHCGLTPDVFTLIGHTGVALMIFESGMHFDFVKARIVGPKACVVAVIGTVFPFVAGTLIMIAYGYPAVPDGVSVGTALAPTSVGIALRLLGEAGVLQQDFGQAIITAAFVDDILSLVLFNVLFSLQGEFDVMATVIKPVIGVVFMGIAIVLAVVFWPNFINNILLPKLPGRNKETKVSRDDEGIFFVMMALLVVYATITHFLGTHLWGCFIAGMSFACLDKPGHEGHTHHLWVRQTKRFTSWMIRIFFSCTVAFSIPVLKLLSFEAFWKGSIMGIFACVLTKVVCAPIMGKAKYVIGWAMVGRAEFAYLIAQMAAAGGMIDESAFSITIWALLYATVLAPFVFRKVLNKYVESEGVSRTKSQNPMSPESSAAGDENPPSLNDLDGLAGDGKGDAPGAQAATVGKTVPDSLTAKETTPRTGRGSGQLRCLPWACGP